MQNDMQDNATAAMTTLAKLLRFTSLVEGENLTNGGFDMTLIDQTGQPVQEIVIHIQGKGRWTHMSITGSLFVQLGRLRPGHSHRARPGLARPYPNMDRYPFPDLSADHGAGLELQKAELCPVLRQ